MKKFIVLFFSHLLISHISTLDFGSFDPIETFTMNGVLSSDWFGSSVNNAGDINNDGYDDVIIGAYSRSSQKGAAYVFYGGPNFASIDLSSHTLDPAIDGFTISGNAASDQFGWAVSSAGDIDNDGYDDIIIGAQGKNLYQGAAYVFYGGQTSNMANIDLSKKTLDPLTEGFKITGSAVGDYFGCSVSNGDFNNDGYSDIIIGAFHRNSSQGAAYVIYGGERSSMSNFDLSSETLDPLTTGFMVTGNAAGDYFGFSSNSAGDINNDGYEDIIIGASLKDSNRGAAYVIDGGEKSSMLDIDLSSDTLDPLTTGFMMTGNAAGDKFGYSCSSAGDMNKDGYGDIVIGAEWKNNTRGVAYIIYGGEKSSMTNINFATTTLDPLTTGFMITGNAVNDNFGVSVRGASDINKDGYDDIVIGAPNKNSSMGAAYAIYGGEKSSMSNIDLSSVTLDHLTTGFAILGTTSSAYFGKSVSAIDINNDGFSELIVGAYRESKAYIFIYNECPENCSQCGSSSVCEVCSTGYGLNSSLLCDTCAPTNCENCTYSNSCDACFSPYLVYSGQCFDLCPSKTFSDSGKCVDCPEECSECTDLSTCQKCVDGYTLSGSKCKKTETQIKEKGSETAAAGVFEGASIVGSSLSSGSSLSFNFGLAAKILRNIKYMNLPVSHELYETFISWKVASGFLSAPGPWSQKYSSKTLPTVFSRYELQTAFLINFWKPLMMTLIGVAVFGTFKLIEVSINDKKSMVFTISKKVNVASSNFALTQFYSNLDDVLFYFVLEMRSTKFETGFRVCSSVLAIALFLVGGILLVMHSKILGKYQKLKEAKSAPPLEDFVAKFMNINLIFKDFKDTNSLTQSFLMINVGRSVLASLIFVTLYEYPMIQISFLIVLNLLMIVYLWSLKSFQEFTNTCSQMFCEIILFIANICVFLLALFDHADYYPVASIERLGKCIIALNLILLFGSALLIALNVGKILYQAYKNKKKPQQSSLSAENIAALTKFVRPIESSNQSTQSFSTNPSGLGGPPKNLQFNQDKNTLQAPEYYQQVVSKNYSIYHPARNNNPSGFAAQIESPPIPSLKHDPQLNPANDFADRSQPYASLKRAFPRSRLLINREITAARIAQFTKKEGSSRYENPGSGVQDSSFHSRVALNQSTSQDASWINFD